MKKFVVSGIQIGIEPNAIRHNTDKCCAWIEKAHKEAKPSLVVFPEAITTGFTPGMPVNAFYDLVEPLHGPSVRQICKVAKALKTSVLFPTYERGKKRPDIYNSAVMINSAGNVVGVYRKSHLFPTERPERGGWTARGTRLPVFNLGFAKVGVTICYEGDFPELSRILAVKGAEIILRPSALLRSFDIWELTNKARAYDNHVYMVAVNAVGPDAGKNHFFGHSMIVDPIAHRLAQARGTEEIMTAELSPNPLRYVTYGTNTRMTFHHLHDRIPGLYQGLLSKPKKGTGFALEH